METRQDIQLFGRHSRPLIQFLSYCTDPFLPGLTTNEEACRFFIMELGIELVGKDGMWKTYSGLDENEKKKLVSGIYVYGKKSGIPEFILKRLVGEVYELKKEQENTETKDAKEFATMLNACGRHEQDEIGIKVAMGDRGEYFRKARTLLQNHRKMLRDGIEWAQKKGAKEMGSIYVLDCGNAIKDTIVGTIAGMLYGAQVIRQDKPIVALSIDDEGKAKISGRATWALVRAGLDLGKAMRFSAEKVSGVGGGHVIAAGANIAPEKTDEFLKFFDEEVGRQMKAGKG
ncbi:MAG: DHHA1 domain-containing protein [Candidatus Micrarchaeota archaeon]